MTFEDFGYLTTDRKSPATVEDPDFEMFDSYEDGRWDEPRVGGFENFRPVYYGPTGDFDNSFSLSATEGTLTIQNTGDFSSHLYDYPTNLDPDGMRWEMQWRNTETIDTSTGEAGWDWDILYEGRYNRILLWNDADDDDRWGMKLVKSDTSDNDQVIGDAITDSDWHTWAAERDASGNWEVFFDGESVHTFTDDWLPDFNDTGHFLHDPVNPDVEVDYMEVTQL